MSALFYINLTKEKRVSSYTHSLLWYYMNLKRLYKLSNLGFVSNLG
jgi:hypothetical protein